MFHLRFGGEMIVIGVELAVIGVEVGDGDVTADHPSAPFNATDTKSHVLILVHSCRQANDDAI